MTYDDILIRIDNLERAFLQAQKNNLPTVGKADKVQSLTGMVEAITPYMDSVRAYIGDTRVTFENVRGTHITAYCETDAGLSIPTRVERSNDMVTVSFEPLDEVATITISSI